MQDHIYIKGARENNLKNIDVTIPRDKLVVLTGLSGSGKSSLAFDTIYAEGQRRYVESLSSYARMFLGQMDKPDVDYIDGTKKNEKKANLDAFKADVDAKLQNDRATQNIAVKGYASPDGPVKFNDKLSKSRSESGKKVVAKLLKDSGLDIDAAAYGEDWDGFKELVEKSNIKDKNLILQVLSLYKPEPALSVQPRNPLGFNQ